MKVAYVKYEVVDLSTDASNLEDDFVYGMVTEEIFICVCCCFNETGHFPLFGLAQKPEV